MQDLAATFHPILWAWFQERLGRPTAAQEGAWPHIRNGSHTLIAAPTGGGKTLSAFFVAIDQLLKQATEGRLQPGVQVLYISPLRALSNDIKKNLEQPFREILQKAQEAGLKPDTLRIGLRTGDTTAAARAQILRRPPQILVTTPESLFLMLSSAKARNVLRTVHTVIVDEIHALARDKRGSHLSLSLEHLSRICPVDPQRIGLSATQKPIETMAAFLCGPHRPCEIVDVNCQRSADLDIIVPQLPLGALCSQEMWSEIYEQLATLIRSHRSTLIFVNTRRLAERITFQLSEMLGDNAVACHHGSLAKDKRLEAEDRLKNGDIQAIIATASLELGIDIGTIDLVCQIGSPRSIAAFVQRVGRSGHALGLTPKARLVALTLDEAIECFGLLRAYREGGMDSIEIPDEPIDILAQHIVSLVSCEELSPDSILTLCRQAYPYQRLERQTLDAILHWLSEGIGTSTRRGAYLHWDKLADQLRPRRHAKLAVISSGGAIPEQNLYRVVDEADQSLVGTVDEEFAIESARGDIFLLGNHSWQIAGLKGDVLLVRDREGAPPTIPFWKGEAGGRTFELSQELSRLRGEISDWIEARSPSSQQPSPDLTGELTGFLQATFQIEAHLATQAAVYLLSQHAALGVIPHQKRIVYERFFDQTGGMQLVVHAPFGSRINRAWGLAFRKRFCRGFDFELQATATDNGILLSVGPNQSFPLEAMFRMLNPQNCREILIQALLDVPMFEIRWRWNVTRALAVLRNKAGKRVPPHLQRYQSNDLLTSVFPGQTQCFEHRTGDLEIPDHPLVQQTLKDCLQEAMDAKRFELIMQSIADHSIELIARDTREPSPFCYELIHANPYAFLDDAPLEERRVRALSTRRSLDPKVFDDLTRLSPTAIAQVRNEAQPLIRDADELYDALKQCVLLSLASLGPYKELLQLLLQQGRAARLSWQNRDFVYTHELKSLVESLYPDAFPEAGIDPGDPVQWQKQSEALRALLRGQLECSGPLLASDLAEQCALPFDHIQAALQELESQGVILSGYFLTEAKAAGEREWCDRRLLQRMHRLTIEGLREQIKPVPISSYLRFLEGHQHLHPARRARGAEGHLAICELLAGWEAPAAAWENEIFNSRLMDWTPQAADQLCLSGRLIWGRMRIPIPKAEKSKTQRLFGRQTRLCFTPRPSLPWVLPQDRSLDSTQLTERAQSIWNIMHTRGALFFDEIHQQIGGLATHCEDALSELISLGFIHSDSFAALRPLVNPDRRQRSHRQGGPKHIRYQTDFKNAGRFAPFAQHVALLDTQSRLEAWAWQLLKRYGIVCRDLLQREELAPTWGELLPVYRTLEARGMIRGGRFVEKLGGEQYALKDSVSELRKVHEQRSESSQDFIVLTATDPANLMGLVDGTAKIPMLSSNRVVLWKGSFVAWKNRGEIHFADIPLAVELRDAMERALRLNGLYRRQDPFCNVVPPPPTVQPNPPRTTTSPLKNWRHALHKEIRSNP